jgi:hypothetical protein
LSSDASDAGSLDVPLDAFTPPQLVQIYLQGLRAEMEEIQNLVVVSAARGPSIPHSYPPQVSR